MTTSTAASPQPTPNSSLIQHQQQHDDAPGGSSSELTTKINSPNSKELPKQNNQSPANTEQKRPMNAFLLFCKRQRSSVREKYPNLENRGITRILGDHWSKLDKEQKNKYTILARQRREAFMKANPDFKWCKTPMNSSNNNNNKNDSNNQIQIATNNSLPAPNIVEFVQSNSGHYLTKRSQTQEAPKPPKKRFLERNNAKADLVPYIDQDILDRVIENALPEKPNSESTTLNMCKYTNRITTTTSSLNASPSSYSTSSPSSCSSFELNNANGPTTSASYSQGPDEPVDFSMKYTYNATNQMIINGLVEKMLSGSDSSSARSAFKMESTDGVKSKLGPPV